MLERESFTVSWVVFLGGPAMAFLVGFGTPDAVNSQWSGRDGGNGEARGMVISTLRFVDTE